MRDITDNKSDLPVMHCQRELEEDLNYDGIIPDSVMLKWFADRYSTSKHLLVLYSIAKGLNAKTIFEIGFGRSSFVLAKAAYENGGRLITCDRDDYSYLLTEKEKGVISYIHGRSDAVFDYLKGEKGIDFAFLDYFSNSGLRKRFVLSELKKVLAFMKTNGIIAIHDAFDSRYRIKGLLKKISKKRAIECAVLPYNYGLGIIRYTGSSSFGELKDMFKKKQDIIG